MVSPNPPTRATKKPKSQTPKAKPLPTIWNVPDPLWELIAKVLAVYDPPATVGRKRSNERLAFDGVIYRLRTG
jgi:hypothetical protein